MTITTAAAATATKTAAKTAAKTATKTAATIFRPMPCKFEI